MSQWSGDVIPVVDSSIHTMNLKDSSVLYEVVIPTCSYRMGVPRMGYGSAVLGKNLDDIHVVLLGGRVKVRPGYGESCRHATEPQPSRGPRPRQ